MTNPGRLPKPTYSDEKLIEEWPHMRRILTRTQACARLADAFGLTETYINQQVSLLGLERTNDQ